MDVIINGQKYVPEPISAETVSEHARILDFIVKPDVRDLPETMPLREYLCKIVQMLWNDNDFNGKRPFGNGSWRFVVYEKLIAEGVVNGALDEDGYVERIDQDAADKLVSDLIKTVFIA